MSHCFWLKIPKFITFCSQTELPEEESVSSSLALVLLTMEPGHLMHLTLLHHCHEPPWPLLSSLPVRGFERVKIQLPDAWSNLITVWIIAPGPMNRTLSFTVTVTVWRASMEGHAVLYPFWPCLILPFIHTIPAGVISNSSPSYSRDIMHSSELLWLTCVHYFIFYFFQYTAL